MLGKALNRLGDEDRPILHSDQGWQYQMPEWSRMLESRNIAASMPRKGNCLDNAAMESFFATLKAEFFYPNRFDSIDSLRNGVEDYIHYYNNHRIRMKLKGLSPVQYRAQPLNSAQTMNRPTSWGQFISAGAFHVWRCLRCGLVQTPLDNAAWRTFVVRVHWAINRRVLQLNPWQGYSVDGNHSKRASPR